MTDDLVKRLRIPLWNDETMRRWDDWRAKHKAGYSGSGTRDDFESLLDAIDDECKEAASALESLTAENAALKAERDKWRLQAQYETDVAQDAIDRNTTLLQQRNEAFERAAGDASLLDILEKHPALELSCSWEDEDGPWEVHRVTGGRNDREWTKIGQGATPREAITAAIRNLSKES